MAEHVGNEILPVILPREAESHKGTYGFLLVIAGSRGYTGAAALTAKGALRAGAGLVTVACPDSVNDILEVKLTEAITKPLQANSNGTFSSDAISELVGMGENFDAVALGPGLAVNDDTIAVVREFLAGCSKPVVVDADGLNALVGSLNVLEKCQSPIILTPHPGEMSRLTGKSTAEIVENAENVACDFAGKFGVVVALKKHNTVVTDGKRVFINDSGNPGMATAGSGDVLTGIIGALLAQGNGMTPFEAAALAVNLHGAAGDMARDAKGEVSMIASDIIDCLPAAFAGYIAKKGTRAIGF